VAADRFKQNQTWVMGSLAFLRFLFLLSFPRVTFYHESSDEALSRRIVECTIFECFHGHRAIGVNRRGLVFTLRSPIALHVSSILYSQPTGNLRYAY
jgi:hypothetical protein